MKKLDNFIRDYENHPAWLESRMVRLSKMKEKVQNELANLFFSNDDEIVEKKVIEYRELQQEYDRIDKRHNEIEEESIWNQWALY